MKSIEEYAKARADLFYGRHRVGIAAKHKEEFIENIISLNLNSSLKANMKWQEHAEGGRSVGITNPSNGFEIQSVLVPKDKFSKAEAIKYIREHFQYRDLDSKQRPNYYSFRQFDPTPNSKYFTKVNKNGVELVFERRPLGPDGIKPKASGATQTLEKGGSFKVHEIYKFIKNGHLEGHEREKIAGYTFIDQLSSRYYQVYQNKKKKIIVINYSGTREISDWLNVFDYLFRTYNISARYKNAKAILETVLKDYPKYKIKLIGYSQSGIIVRELAKVYSDEIFEIISLNSGNLSIYEGDAPEHEYVIKSDLDFASYFRRPEKNDLIIPSETSNIATEHLPEILFRLNPDLEIGRK